MIDTRGEDAIAPVRSNRRKPLAAQHLGSLHRVSMVYPAVSPVRRLDQRAPAGMPSLPASRRPHYGNCAPSARSPLRLMLRHWREGSAAGDRGASRIAHGASGQQNGEGIALRSRCRQWPLRERSRGGERPHLRPWNGVCPSQTFFQKAESDALLRLWFMSILGVALPLGGRYMKSFCEREAPLPLRLYGVCEPRASIDLRVSRGQVPFPMGCESV